MLMANNSRQQAQYVDEFILEWSCLYSFVLNTLTIINAFVLIVKSKIAYFLISYAHTTKKKFFEVNLCKMTIKICFGAFLQNFAL